MSASTESNTLPRRELYEKVWSTPVSRLASTLGLSDRGLAKKCDRHRIPRPGRGYWQKLRHGKDPDRAPLPELKAGEDHLKTVRLKRSNAPKEARSPEGPVAKQRKFEKDDANQLVVPDKITDPHPLVRSTRDALKDRESPRYRRGQYKRIPRGSLDVRVSGDALPRALRVMDALLKGLDERGFELRLSEHDGQTLVSVRDTDLPVRVEEEYKRIEVEPDRVVFSRAGDDLPARTEYEFQPTGKLKLMIPADSFRIPGVRKTWADGKTQEVEGLLNSFVVGLVRAAVVKKNRAREREERRRKREEKLRKRRERRRQLKEEKERREELLDQAEAWGRAEKLRGLIEAVRRQGQSQGSGEVAEKLQAWMMWAEDVANDLDPTKVGY